MRRSVLARTRALVSAALLAALSSPGGAQAPAAANPPRLDAPTRRAVIDTLAARLRRHYVDADTGALIADHLRSRLAAGAYDTITSPGRFAELVTTDLRAVNDDRHLNLTYNPEAPGLRPGPEGIRMFGPPPPVPNGPPRTGPAADAARRINYSLGTLDVLAGNVGYLDIRGFSGAPEVVGAITAALNYLRGTDAIIFDLRRNGGGSPFSVNMIISHFTTADTLASLTVRNRSGNETFTRYTLASVPGPRRPDVPLYVLTSRGTASAGEDFSFVLKNLHRATLVGDTTAGAGHNNANVAVGHGFNASISFTRVMDPKTGAEWERVGVIPDVAVDPARALDVAHAMALKRIASSETDPRRGRVLDLIREGVEARSAGRSVPAAALQAFSGEYEGGRTVAVEDGRLVYSPRRGLLPEPLVPLGNDTFASNANRIAFVRDASGRYALRLTPPEGESLTYQRVR